MYDADNSRLLWVDYLDQRIRELALCSDGSWRAGRTWTAPAPVSLALPRSAGGLLAVCGATVLSVDDDGTFTRFTALDEDPATTRMNDGKCDVEGRLVMGWIDEGGMAEGRLGGVVRIDGAGVVEPIGDDVMLANGLDWSPGGDTLYVVDTAALTVDAFDYAATDPLSNRRTVVTIERGAGAPDGLAVDDEGCLWIAVPYAGQLRRYTAAGELVAVVATPTLLPTSCGFGGPDGDMLFITSQTEGLMPIDAENDLGIELERVRRAHADPAAGGLFVCRPNVSGPPARAFNG